MKRTLSWFVIIAVIIVGVWFFWTERTMAPVVDNGEQVLDPLTPAPAPTVTNNYPDLIQVDSPIGNAVVTSPLTVTGRARGTWYFEASFPLELRNSSNLIIAQSVAQAQSDWMTSDFVPFSATLTFVAQPAGSTGTLILRNDNPSGEPVNDKSISIPVQF